MLQYPVLSIAGFDNSGGAGLQADLKVFTSFACYGMTTVTAIAVQNTCGVKECHMIPCSVIESQLTSIFEDIPPVAIKIGMLFNEEIIQTIVKTLKLYPDIPVILDPVMMAKSGDPLLLPEARKALVRDLLPLATLVTPNVPEALELIGENTLDLNAIPALDIAKRILSLGVKNVLLKGGHYKGENSTDMLVSYDNVEEFTLPRIKSKNTHGTGCTLSAAITALIAKNIPLPLAIKQAKQYLSHAIASSAQQSLGQGAGPTDHTWWVTNQMEL